MSAEIGQATIFEDSGVVIMDRVIFDDGAAIQQADISTITYGVWDTSTGTATVAAGTALNAADVVFDTLQTDARWEGTDIDGYNFRVTLPASAFPTGGITYRAEFKFTPGSGQPLFVVWDITTKEVRTS